MTALWAEAMILRHPSALWHASPVLALLVPLGGYSGALPPIWAHCTVFACLGVLEAAAFVLAASHQAELYPLHAELTHASVGLLAAWLGLLACWQGSAIHAQQRLVHVLAMMVHRQEERTAAILRTVLPAPLIESMGSPSGVPILFHPQASIIVARPVGLCEMIQAERAAAMAARVLDTWEAAMEAHGCMVIPECGDLFVAVCGGPKPFGRHAEKACTAAIAAVESFRKLSADVGAPIALQCGVHSGRLFSGAVGGARASFTVWGETLTRADELHRLAPTDGGAVASQDTLEAVSEDLWTRRRHAGPRHRLAFTNVERAHEAFFLGTRPSEAGGPDPFRSP